MLQTINPPVWPASVPRVFRPLARVKLPRPATRDDLAVREAVRVRQREDAIRCSFLTGTVAEVFYQNRADFTAFNTSSAEGSLLAGLNEQPVIPALFFHAHERRTVTIEAAGILGTTSTPTIIFQVRFGTTAGSSFLSGTSVGVTAAITTQSGVTNQYWFLRLDMTCNTPGLGSGNTTLSGAGYVMSPGGFASPFSYPLETSTPPTATWTATIDGSVTQYVNLSVTWSASSASNTITCKSLRAYGWN